jgi:hypothetical protein
MSKTIRTMTTSTTAMQTKIAQLLAWNRRTHPDFATRARTARQICSATSETELDMMLHAIGEE